MFPDECDECGRSMSAEKDGAFFFCETCELWNSCKDWIICSGCIYLYLSVFISVDPW